ncbi:hypothetical protein [Xylella fastidiosa]|uniref:hypothetical protein n=1 Tax=Xylella fastidiosa TaxID=2371 RepID=UPI0018AFEBBF|nr:hypothetical protein [Xylella fastidiosa]
MLRRGWGQCRQIQIRYRNFPGHQFVEQGFEHVLKDMALAVVQVDLAVDGVENGCDLALFPSIPGNQDQQRIKMLLVELS